MLAQVMKIVQQLIQFAQSLVSVNVNATSREMLSAGVRERLFVSKEVKGEMPTKNRMLRSLLGTTKNKKGILKTMQILKKKTREKTLVWKAGRL